MDIAQVEVGKGEIFDEKGWEFAKTMVIMRLYNCL